jgi:hypothetical protein
MAVALTDAGGGAGDWTTTRCGFGRGAGTILDAGVCAGGGAGDCRLACSLAAGRMSEGRAVAVTNAGVGARGGARARAPGADDPLATIT